MPDASGFRNEPIRQAVLTHLNSTPEYRRLFGEIFPAVANGGSIDFTMFARAIAEFEFTLVFTDAPLDRFARESATQCLFPKKRRSDLFRERPLRRMPRCVGPVE